MATPLRRECSSLWIRRGRILVVILSELAHRRVDGRRARGLTLAHVRAVLVRVAPRSGTTDMTQHVEVRPRTITMQERILNGLGLLQGTTSIGLRPAWSGPKVR